jgi:hypothetical protein
LQTVKLVAVKGLKVDQENQQKRVQKAQGKNDY